MGQSSQNFSFHLSMSNPRSRLLMRIVEEVRAAVSEAAEAGANASDDGWHVVPQADGVWVHGNEISRGLLVSLQEFSKRTGTPEISFAYEGDSGGGEVTITAANITITEAERVAEIAETFPEPGR